MNEKEKPTIVTCSECKHGHFLVTCKLAKKDHSKLKYNCNFVNGNHNPDFFCAYGVAKEN